MSKCPVCEFELLDEKCNQCGFGFSKDDPKLKEIKKKFELLDEEESSIDSKIEIFNFKETEEEREKRRILFDEDAPTQHQVVSNLDKLVIPKDKLKSEKETAIISAGTGNVQLIFDEDSPTVPQEVTGLNKLAILEQPKYKENKIKEEIKEKLEKEKLEKEKFNPFVNKNEKDESKERKSFIVSGFFKRTFISLLDQIVVFILTFLFFLIVIKPQVKTPYTSFEAITDFIISYRGLFFTLFFAFVLINFIYYTSSNIIFGGTFFSNIFGYKLYKDGEKPSSITFILRNITMLTLNLFMFLFPFLFIFVSDYKQALYDKIFKVYFSKPVK